MGGEGVGGGLGVCGRGRGGYCGRVKCNEELFSHCIQ